MVKAYGNSRDSSLHDGSKFDGSSNVTSWQYCSELDSTVEGLMILVAR